MTGSDVRLTLQLVDLPGGRCEAILTDEDGNVLLEQIYKNRNSAGASVRTRLKKEGLGDAVLTRIRPGDDEDQDEDQDGDGDEAPSEALPERPPTASGRWLEKLRYEAQKALDEALKLRQKADALEVEHKRLTAAADVLEGPEDVQE